MSGSASAAAAAAAAAASAQPEMHPGEYDDLDLTMDMFGEAQFGGPGSGHNFLAALADLADSEPTTPSWPTMFPGPGNVPFYERQAVRAEIQFCDANGKFLWAPGAIVIPPEKLQAMNAGHMTHDIYEQPIGDAVLGDDAMSSAAAAATAASAAAHVFADDDHAAHTPTSAAAAAAAAALTTDAMTGSAAVTVGTHDSLMALLVQEGLAAAHPSTITPTEEEVAIQLIRPTRFIPPRGFFIVVVHAEGPDSEPFGIMEAYDFTAPALALGPATQQERDAATHVQSGRKRSFTWLEHVARPEELDDSEVVAADAPAGDEDMTRHACANGGADDQSQRTKFSRSAEDGSAAGTAAGYASTGSMPSPVGFAWPTDPAFDSWTNQLARDGFWVSIKREAMTGLVSGVRIGFPFGSLIVRAKINALFSP